MNLNWIIFLALFIILKNNSALGQLNNKLVILSGYVKHFNNQIQIEDMSEMKSLTLPNLERIGTLDSNNHFLISFELKKPGYFRLGRNILYLSPGDSLEMNINWIWQDSSEFKGKGKQANEYLKFLPFPKAGSFLEGGYKLEKTLNQIVEKIFKTADHSISYLNKTTNVSDEFKFLEITRINANVLNSLIMIKEYYPYNRENKDSLKKFMEDYEKIVSPYIKLYSKRVEINPDYLQLVVYRQIISSILIHQVTNKNNKRIVMDWIRAAELVQKFKSIDNKQNISLYEKEIKAISCEKYRTAVINTFEELMKFRNGDSAVDFEMLNIDKNSIRLSSFKGKVIYIDLWATWCGPCIEELPYLDSLKANYKNNQQIIFIALSIDDDGDKWMRNISNRNETNNQYLIDRAKLEGYSVTQIPRVIIIDKDFKIAVMHGDLPSSKNLYAYLNKLLE